MKRVWRYLVVAGVMVMAPVGASQPAAAAADCEKVQNWHAYNLCLAQAGPKRGQRAARISGGGDPEKTVPSGTGRGGRARAARADFRNGHPMFQTKGNGRRMAVFDVGPTAGSAKRR
ncbi:MAG: hypothetical protein ACRCXM_14915 [Beijerinckiaceae bacterium]